MTTADTSTTSQVTVVTHPLVQHKLGLLRDVTTTTQMFRQLVNELTLLLTYEATKDLADEEIGKRRVGKECRSRWSPYH